MNGNRPHVLWYGGRATRRTFQACRARGLRVSGGSGDLSSGKCSTAAGVVIKLEDNDDADALAAYTDTLRTARWHDLPIIVLADVRQVPSIDRFRRSLRYGGRVTLWARSREKHVPEMLARAASTAAWSSEVQVDGDSDLSAEEKVLVRRSFSDCKTAALVRQPGGRSAKVFCVYARLRDSKAGPLPLPFFAKFDRYTKVTRELDNYRTCTTLFVPFNQRPNVDAHRCVLGAERGLIVGNFVEESETLKDLVERGTARSAINSLFGGALRGWRSQAYFDKSNTVTRSLIESLPGFMPSEMPAFRRQTLAKHAEEAMTPAIGATLTPDKLERVFRRLPRVAHRVAMMHGDLHGENVRVHRAEAILIDFASTGNGPLVSDPASLDVALTMGAYSITGDAWRTFATELYALSNLRVLPQPCDPTKAGAALWNSIRLIRHIALGDQLSEPEYATAVAIHLLRRASYPQEPGEEPGRRKFAYLLAEQLATELSGPAAKSDDAA